MEQSYETAVGLPAPTAFRGTRRDEPEFGWVGLQAFRYRNSAPNEVHIGLHFLRFAALSTRPPAKMSIQVRSGEQLGT